MLPSPDSACNEVFRKYATGRYFDGTVDGEVAYLEAGCSVP